MDPAQDIELLALGLIPASLNYNLQKTETIDWAKLEYAKYRQPMFYYNKLPKAVKNLPGIYNHCEKMALNSVSPLESLMQIETVRSLVYDA